MFELDNNIEKMLETPNPNRIKKLDVDIEKAERPIWGTPPKGWIKTLAIPKAGYDRAHAEETVKKYRAGGAPAILTEDDSWYHIHQPQTNASGGFKKSIDSLITKMQSGASQDDIQKDLDEIKSLMKASPRWRDHTDPEYDKDKTEAWADMEYEKERERRAGIPKYTPKLKKSIDNLISKMQSGYSQEELQEDLNTIKSIMKDCDQKGSMINSKGKGKGKGWGDGKGPIGKPDKGVVPYPKGELQKGWKSSASTGGGAAIGSAVGGPVGAAVGGLAGKAIGNKIDKTKKMEKNDIRGNVISKAKKERFDPEITQWLSYKATPEEREKFLAGSYYNKNKSNKLEKLVPAIAAAAVPAAKAAVKGAKSLATSKQGKRVLGDTASTAGTMAVANKMSNKSITGAPLEKSKVGDAASSASKSALKAGMRKISSNKNKDKMLSEAAASATKAGIISASNKLVTPKNMSELGDRAKELAKKHPNVTAGLLAGGGLIAANILRNKLKKGEDDEEKIKFKRITMDKSPIEKKQAHIKIEKAIHLLKGYTPISDEELRKTLGGILPIEMEEYESRPPKEWWEFAIVKSATFTDEPVSYTIKSWYGDDIIKKSEKKRYSSPTNEEMRDFYTDQHPESKPDSKIEKIGSGILGGIAGSAIGNVAGGALGHKVAGTLAGGALGHLAGKKLSEKKMEKSLDSLSEDELADVINNSIEELFQNAVAEPASKIKPEEDLEGSEISDGTKMNKKTLTEKVDKTKTY